MTHSKEPASSQAESAGDRVSSGSPMDRGAQMPRTSPEASPTGSSIAAPWPVSASSTGPTPTHLRGPHVTAVTVTEDGSVSWLERDPAHDPAGTGVEASATSGSNPGDELPELVVVPVQRAEGGPALLDGMSTTLRIGAQDVAVVVDERRSARHRFTGALGTELSMGAAGAGQVELVLVGVGEARGFDLDTLRILGASALRSAGRARAVLVVVPASLIGSAGDAGGVDDDAAHAAGRAGRALAEGVVLGSYRFTPYKSDRDEEPHESGSEGAWTSDAPGGGAIQRVVVAVGSPVPLGAIAEGIAKGVRLARATWFARDLVNEPPSSLTPSTLADWVRAELAASPDVEVEIWDEHRITAEHLGGLLGVARGSAEEPRLIWARYRPAQPVRVDGAVPHLVLVGKGITFDSGGLSLKTAAGMTTMKTDMSGAAAVLAAVSACGEMGVAVQVTAIAAVTENMPGGRAIKPGDVLRARNGKTIEVLNTDAEGRLVLADALSLASELQPDAIVDVATLTGACVVALGGQIAGVMGNDDGLVARVRAAADRAGEKTWPLPLPDEYRAHIDSEVADMKNVGKNGQAGAIAAALLLENFVGATPWAHLDIAGPARSDEERGLLAKGGTGFGVRTLVSLAEMFAVRAEHYGAES